LGFDPKTFSRDQADRLHHLRAVPWGQPLGQPGTEQAPEIMVQVWCLLGARLPERLSPRHGPQVVEAVCLISAMIVPT
jgi:hypothetical protein